MKNAFYKKILIPAVSAAALFSFFAQAGAQTESGGIPENLAPLAQELGCNTQEECAQAFDSNFEKGMELAEKHGIYSADQQKIATSFRQEVISKLSGIGDENFEEEILKIAQEILKKPTIAKTLKVDKEEVKAVQTIITEVKNAGVNVDVCSRPAESLSREELIACLEASKKLANQSSVVEKYIPKGIKERTKMLDATVGLETALGKGEYADLGKTAEEVGQKCLRPGSESLKVCDEIAEKYFGPQGVKELAAARTQNAQAGDFYLKNLANLELITPEGRKIAGKEAIRSTCDGAFQRREINLARACGDFAVKNGLADKKEVEDGLKIFEQFASKPQVNFDDCRNNPESCKEFIPEEFRKDFDSEIKIYQIMKAEMGFDPIQCERANFDLEIGKKCFEGSQKALPKLKELSGQYPEALRIISEIEFGMKEQERHSQRQEEFTKVFQNQGGPGGCKSEQECFAYCSDPAHGAECISFGARHDVFEGADAVERYQKYNDALNVPPPFYGESYQVGASGVYNNQQGGTGTGSMPYPANYRPAPPPAFYHEGDFGGPVGPSPECFAAIQSGDFIKAKEICNAPANFRPVPPPPYQQFSSIPGPYPTKGICPAMPEFDCPAGYQKIYKTTPDGCGVSECVTFRQQVCPPDQYWKVTGSGDQGYCAQKESYSSYSYDPKERCYKEGGAWTGEYCKYPDYNQQSSYSYSSSNYQNTATCPSNLVNLLGSGCHYMYNDNSGNRIYCNGEMTRSAKYGDAVAAEGCSTANTGNYSSYAAPSGQREQIWNNYGLRSWVRTDADTTRIESLKQVCGSVTSSWADIWMPGAGDYTSQNFGMPDEAKCRAWTSGSQSSHSYSSYGSYSSSNANNSSTGTGNGSSYSYSSYSYSAPSGQREQIWNNYGLRSWVRTDADTTRIESLKQVCGSVTSSWADIWMPGAGNSGSVDFGMPDEAKCRAWSPSSQAAYSSYNSGGYSSYAGDANSCPGFSYSRWDSSGRRYCQLNNERKCDYNYPSYLTNGTNYKAENCPASDSSYGGYSSYGNYSSYSYSSSSVCPSNLLGSGCHDMGNAYFNGAMDQYVNYGGSTVKNCTTEYINGCTSWSNNSSYSAGGSYSSYSYSSPSGTSYSSYDSAGYCTQSGGTWNGSYCQYSSTGGTSYSSYDSGAYASASYSSAAAYSSYDASAACAQSGGSWNGSSCVMPNTASSAAAVSSAAPDPSAACAQAGGTWDGTTCVMPAPTADSGEGGIMANLANLLKGIISIFAY